jgi:DNA-binding CsgD family transcriptional regulator
VEFLRESVDVLEHSGNQFQLAKSLVELGCRLRADDEQAALAYLRRGRDLASELGASRLVAKTGSALERLSTGDFTASPPPALTKSERRVVELVVAGHTNQGIADILQVTCRAVEKHLTNSFRKLGVRGRAELPDVLAKMHPPVTG